jgi:SAM-dependent methyltransferase
VTGVGGETNWTGLARYYDRLFPPGPSQVEFVTRVLSAGPKPARRVLDIGCATGGYALALAEAGFEVTGVDLDPEMVRGARARAEEWASGRKTLQPGAAGLSSGPPPRFFIGDMTDLRDLPDEETRPFDGVICLGNTLAHMLSAAELGAALGEMSRLLAPGGRAVIQTVNYDRLAATGEARFPPITAQPGLVFERLYLPRSDGLVNFVTTLREARAGRAVFRAETLLRPVLREELVTVARMAFHGEVEVYGDFLFSSWTEASPATVVVAVKGPVE